MVQPTVLSPTPDPAFVRELKRIDPDLRVVWGYQRYLQNEWVIERKKSPENYFKSHAALFEEGGPRFVAQPIFDSGQPIMNEEGEVVAYQKIGERMFDLAPEYEHVMGMKTLSNQALIELRRAYAWHQNHPISRMRFEQKAEEERKSAEFKKQICEATDAAMDQVFLETRRKVQFGHGATRRE